MKYMSTYNDQSSGLKICKNDVCIEAYGDNAKIIAFAIAIAIICCGVAALLRAN